MIYGILAALSISTGITAYRNRARNFSTYSAEDRRLAHKRSLLGIVAFNMSMISAGGLIGLIITGGY